MKEYKIKDLRAALVRGGFSPVRVKGSHEIWRRNGRIVVLPIVTLAPVIANKIIKENNLEI